MYNWGYIGSNIPIRTYIGIYTNITDVYVFQHRNIQQQRAAKYSAMLTVLVRHAGERGAPILRSHCGYMLLIRVYYHAIINHLLPPVHRHSYLFLRPPSGGSSHPTTDINANAEYANPRVPWPTFTALSVFLPRLIAVWKPQKALNVTPENLCPLRIFYYL